MKLSVEWFLTNEISYKVLTSEVKRYILISRKFKVR